MMFSNNIVFVVVTYLLFQTALRAVDGFASPLFQVAAANQRLVQSKIETVDVELPDLDELFNRIQQVSPLARQVIENNNNTGNASNHGFNNIEEGDLKWRKVDANKKKLIHQIDKIDNFQNEKSPILRFRSSMKGPCLGEPFANFIMTYDERRKWDAQINKVDEVYPIEDLGAVNELFDIGQYGRCSKIGVGYCQTKANLGISPREQLTLCGVQDYNDGSCVIWGVEMPSWHDHLLPKGTRHTRAKSHIFCTTLTPTSDDSFDVEYVLQMDAGGNLPGWLTTNVMIETVKSLFHHAESYYKGGEGSQLEKYISEQTSRLEVGSKQPVSNDLDDLLLEAEATYNRINGEFIDFFRGFPVGFRAAIDNSVLVSALKKTSKFGNTVKSLVRQKLSFTNA